MVLRRKTLKRERTSKKIGKGICLGISALLICIATAYIFTGEAAALMKNGCWDIKADGKTVATVKSREEGEEALARLKMEYYSEVKEQLAAKADQFVTIEKRTDEVSKKAVRKSENKFNVKAKKNDRKAVAEKKKSTATVKKETKKTVLKKETKKTVLKKEMKKAISKKDGTKEDLAKEKTDSNKIISEKNKYEQPPTKQPTPANESESEENSVEQVVDEIKDTEAVTFSKNEIKIVDEGIPYKTKIKYTKKMYRGQWEIKQQGQNGTAHIVKKITTTNGKVVEEKIISKTVTISPTTEIIYKGTKEPAEKTRKRVIAYGKKFLGTKYVWGGESLKNGIDCSGFTMQVYKHFGYTLPHYSQAQANCGKRVESLSKAKAGDLIIYSGHVAMYCGKGTIIHATPPKIIAGTAADYTKILAIRRIIE